MSVQRKPRSDKDPLFTVVVEQEIGAVYEDPNSEETAHVTAFKMIGEHGTPGVYRFPLETGQVCVINVEHADQYRIDV